jgi:DNA replication and repair protein RecF
VHVRHLTLKDFRSYPSAELALTPGVTTLVGLNGQGKTNLVEAVGYLATLGSHRVATDQPLVRFGAAQAIIRGAIIRDGRETMVELEITPGRANRARVNGAALPRTRDVVGILRTVMFSPDDLALVKGDPSDRRHFLDALLTLRTPRLGGVKSDYDRVLKQRNALLKSARGRQGSVDLSTLDIWDDKLATLGAEIMAQRMNLLMDLGVHLASAYLDVAAEAPSDRRDVRATYKASVDLPPDAAGDPATVRTALLAGIESRRRDELERGISLVGPHRDEAVLEIGAMPAKGYASHGESWSLALALRLASFALLREEGDDPVLILDDVFAELDQGRREQLASLVGDAEQVLVTAAVADDVPKSLLGRRFRVEGGRVQRD